MSRSRISSCSREIVLNRLVPLVGPLQRIGFRGACYSGDGSLFMVRTAESSTCRPDDRLHWTRIDEKNRRTIEKRAREAKQAGRPFDIVLATLFEAERELLIWAVPYAVLQEAIGRGALYIYEEGGRHVARISGEERPLGDLDLHAYLFRNELTVPELEAVRAARSREN